MSRGRILFVPSPTQQIDNNYMNTIVLKKKQILSEETKQKVSKSLFGRFRGEDNPRWKRIKKICPICEKEFWVQKIRENTAHYCSYACMAEDYKKRLKGKGSPCYNSIKVKCDYCGKEFLRIPARIKKHKYQFCNRVCQGKWASLHRIGENSPHYQGGKKEVKCAWCGKVKRVFPCRKYEKHFCNRKCYAKWQGKYTKGENSPSYKIEKKKVKCAWCGRIAKVSLCRKYKKYFCNRKCYADWQEKYEVGENSNAYKNGNTPLFLRIRKSKRMEKWRKAVFMRDNFIDQKYKQKGDFLNAHHIITFSELLRKHNIQTLEQSKNCMELWDISNGITLSKKSHLDFHKIYGLKNNNREQLNEFLSSEKSKVA